MRKIKFPLILKNISCNTLNEVKQNFDIEEMIGYFHDKRLLKWLKDRSLEKELISVEKLSIDDPKFPTKLAEIFEVKNVPKVDIKQIIWLVDRKNLLQQSTDDENIIAKAIQSAIDQKELNNLLKKNFSEIILINNTFEIPANCENKTFIGVGKTAVKLKNDELVNVNKFINVEGLPKPPKELDDLLNDLEEVKKVVSEIVRKMMDIDKGSMQKIRNMRFTPFETIKAKAENGNPYAMRELGEIFERGDWGWAKNIEKAIYWYQKAIYYFEKHNRWYDDN